MKVTIRSTISPDYLAQHLDRPFDYLVEPDFGMLMNGTMYVMPEASIAAYQEIHMNWPERVSAAASSLAALKPTLLLSNVPYLSLAAAGQAKIPAVAFSAVNWADVFRHYCIELPGAKKIFEQMVEAYACADIFLQPVPGMPMPSIQRHQLVGPVASIGRKRKGELCGRLSIASDTLIVLFALGGIPTEVSSASWPRFRNLRILMGSKTKSNHSDVTMCDNLDIPFIDLVCSSDVVLTKPGYGLVIEAACNGKPLLLLPRKHWPETPAFVNWLEQHGRMLPLSEEKLRSGDFLGEINEVLRMRSPPIPPATGAAEVAAILAARLN